MTRRPFSFCGLAIAVLLGSGALVACSSSGHQTANATGPMSPTASLGSVSTGDIMISNAYIPSPASPSVAAAYLAITNRSDAAIKLVKVVTSATMNVMAMNESDQGGVGTMTDIANVIIPADATMQFVPNHAHLMLENPKPLKAGDQVAMTLTFSPGGVVRITVPVLAFDQTPTQVPATLTQAPGNDMSSMPGMSMPGN